jgi:hypothetical protein
MTGRLAAIAGISPTVGAAGSRAGAAGARDAVERDGADGFIGTTVQWGRPLDLG